MKRLTMIITVLTILTAINTLAEPEFAYISATTSTIAHVKQYCRSNFTLIELGMHVGNGKKLIRFNCSVTPISLASNESN